MAKRPLLYDVWAKDALPEDIGDADTFVPSNPAYPDPQTNQYKTGWTVPGKMDVKQPHQWVNSWYQGVDYTLTMQRSGELGWDSGVTYRQGATCLYNGKRWTAQSSNTNKVPSDTSTFWHEAEFGLQSVAQAKLKLQQITAALDAHFNNASDPHQVDWSKFFNGVGASTSTIDGLVSTATKNIDDHKKDKGNPHQLNCAQVKVLPAATGGIFTGPVSMLRMLKAGGTAIRRNNTCFEMSYSTYSFGVRTGEACKDDKVVLTFNNYRSLKNRNNPKFSVPTPAIHLPLTSDLNVYTASGTGIEYLSTGTIEYTTKSGQVATAAINVPGFGKLGLELRPNKGQKLNLTGTYTGTRGTVSAVLDDTVVLADIQLDKTNILEYFPTGTAIRDIRIWNQPLTAPQKAALGFR